jgi:hypothetical protein
MANRSRLKAAALGVVPGLGHMYLRDWRKGVALFGVFVAVELLGLDLDLTVIGAALGVPLELGGGTALWLYSMLDAYRTGTGQIRATTLER